MDERQFYLDAQKMIQANAIQNFELAVKAAASHGESRTFIWVTPTGYAYIKEKYGSAGFKFEVDECCYKPVYERINIFQKRQSGIKYVTSSEGQIKIWIWILDEPTMVEIDGEWDNKTENDVVQPEPTKGA